MNTSPIIASDRLMEIVEECARLVDSHEWLREDPASVAFEPLPSLLDQIRLITEETAAEAEPIRLVHHLACTGGTLFSRCLAAMPNTMMLSEVAPHSRLGGGRSGNRFFPTDLARLVRMSLSGSSVGLETDIFLAGLRPVMAYCRSRGMRLVLRDHAHSMFCSDDWPSDAPALGRLLGSDHATRAVVTVRHPLDSFLSLRVNRWVHFTPGTLEEYAGRYHSFLDEYQGLDLYRYEDLVSDPDVVMGLVCASLELPCIEHFEALIGIQHLSGDSGRTGNRIAARERRDIPEDLQAELGDAPRYRSLCERLGYPPD